jgi:quinol monooxygenase YgiN
MNQQKVPPVNRPLILVRFEPKPGMTGEVETVLGPMVPSTRAEPGNLRYDLYGSTDAAGTALFWLVEQYASDEAAAAHRETAHYKDYRPKILPLLVHPPQVQLLQPIDIQP